MQLSRMALGGILAVLAVTPWLSNSTPSRASAAPPNWRPLRVGAGGFLTGLDISPDGKVKLVRADTYGAFLWDETRKEWRQLVTVRSMPASERFLHWEAGVYEIRVAPSDPARFYMVFDGLIYRSDDAGQSWRRTRFPQTAMDANGPFRTNGQKMAVDPVSADRVLVGTPEKGMFLTVDGGESWSSVVGLPPGEASSDGGYPGIVAIAFDPRSSQPSGRTASVYASSYGHGIYRSQDGGRTWAPLEGGPRSATHARVATDGAYYIIGDEGAAVWRFDGANWADITPDGEHGARQKGAWGAVVTDPSRPERILIARADGSLMMSSDRGDRWRRRGASGRLVRIARDVPWLAWTEERFMTVGDMALDPSQPNQLWFAEGVGVWRTSVRDGPGDDIAIAYTSQSEGIEQLVADQIITPPGGKPLLASWDRPVFRIDEPGHYPGRHGPDNAHAIVMGWALDFAPKEPDFVAGLFNWWDIEASGFSRDAGRTWTRFSSYPPLMSAGKIGGSIAVSSPLNIVWAPSNNGAPYYTQDGGDTWLAADVPGVPRTGDTGWGYAYFLNRHIVAADRESPLTFYLYNTPRGLFRSTDGGATWALFHAGEIAPWSGYNADLRAVPGQAGNLFFTSGPQGSTYDPHPAKVPLMRSVDGGKSWTPLNDVLEVHSLGFGKGTGVYPSILIVGWVKGDYGVWRSDDAAANWRKIGDFPLGVLSLVAAIEGDSDTRRVYVGFRGAGYAVLQENGDASANTP